MPGRRPSGRAKRRSAGVVDRDVKLVGVREEEAEKQSEMQADDSLRPANQGAAERRQTSGAANADNLSLVPGSV